MGVEVGNKSQGEAGKDLASQTTECLAAAETADGQSGLLPCPFCGSHAHIEQIGKPDSYSPAGYFAAVCVVCDALINYRCSDEQEAADRWNTRARARQTHYNPNWLWCERCQAWIETQHECGAQYIDRGTHFELVRPAFVINDSPEVNVTADKGDNSR